MYIHTQEELVYKLNHIQYPKVQTVNIEESYSLNALVDNDLFEKLTQQYKKQFGFSKLKTFSFTKEGFLGLLLELGNSSIAISLGESQALIDAGELYEKLGFEIIWLGLNKDGKVNLSNLENRQIDFLFLSSYVMDTFVITDIQTIKKQTKVKIISNATAHHNTHSDVIYFDTYKLTGYNTNSVLLFNNEIFSLLPIGQIDSLACKLCFDLLVSQHFNKTSKSIFLENLISTFKDDIYFFVEPKDTLEYTLHFGLKNIKARELIRTLALNEIYITNGEGCSLGLSKPSRIIQSMGYEENSSRNAISLSFVDDINEEEINQIIKTIHLKYKQIKMLS